jgi:hypothetical protein
MSNDYADRDALELLQTLKAEVFHGNTDELAVAMGRPESEINAWFSGEEQVDDDAEMKIRGIAKERLGDE